MTAQTRGRLPQGLPRRPCRWDGTLSIGLALLALDAPQTWACGGWTCGDGRYAYRPAPGAYGYGRPRVQSYRRPAWAYGYTSPARVYGYAYAPWPSIAMPPARWY